MTEETLVRERARQLSLVARRALRAARLTPSVELCSRRRGEGHAHIGPAVNQAEAQAIRRAFLEGTPLAALAARYGISARVLDRALVPLWTWLDEDETERP